MCMHHSCFGPACSLLLSRPVYVYCRLQTRSQRMLRPLIWTVWSGKCTKRINWLCRSAHRQSADTSRRSLVLLIKGDAKTELNTLWTTWTRNAKLPKEELPQGGRFDDKPWPLNFGAPSFGNRTQARQTMLSASLRHFFGKESDIGLRPAQLQSWMPAVCSLGA